MGGLSDKGNNRHGPDRETRNSSRQEKEDIIIIINAFL